MAVNMCDQLERDMGLAEVAYHQHRNDLLALLKQKNQDLLKANHELQLVEIRQQQRNDALAFEQSVIIRMQALEQTVAGVEEDCQQMTDQHFQRRLDELTTFILVQLKAHASENERQRRQLERAKMDYDKELERLEGLLAQSEKQRDGTVTALDQVRLEHQKTVSGPGRCKELEQRLEQLMDENDKQAQFNDRLVGQLELLLK